MIKSKRKEFTNFYNNKLENTPRLHFFNSSKNILKELAKDIAKDEKIRKDKLIGL